MTKLPSPYRVPEQYLMTHDELVAEDEIRTFQRQVNGHSYLSWYALARRVKPERKYEIKTFGFKHETCSGQQILDNIRPIVDSRCCTFVDSVTPVPDDYETPVEKLWRTITDEHGRLVVENYAEDVWDYSALSSVTPESSEIITDAYGAEILDRVVEIVVQRRLDGHDQTPDFDQVLAVTRLAVINGLALLHTAGMPPENTISIAGERACETFDRAFHGSRIKAAGIDVNEHPEFRSYQKFFELGMPPPTHAQMADTIISTFGDPPEAADRQAKPDP